MKRQPSVRAINSRLADMRSYCYVYLKGSFSTHCVRIARARTRNGVVEGRVICGSPETWIEIPPDATVELSS